MLKNFLLDQKKKESELKRLKALCRKEILVCEREIDDREAWELIEKIVLKDSQLRMNSHYVKTDLIYRIFYNLRCELDFLQKYAEDSGVSEIMVNGKDHVFIERNGRIEKVEETFTEVEDLEEVIRRIVGKVHREINEMNPIVDARLSDGSRVNAIYKNIALNGPILTIRRFPKNSIKMEDLIQWQTITKEASEYLISLVRAGYNIFLSGRTNSGKTTLLNVLTDFIPEEERVVVIEDSAELQIRENINVVRLETKNANVQGKGEITIRDLIRASLRMRPDRIIVGEVRGGEIVDMIVAMQTGHDGSLSSGHGNSPAGMLRRMEGMFLSVADYPLESVCAQIAEAVDIIVHLDRLPDKSRKVMEITEVLNYEQGEIKLNTLFKYVSEQGLLPTGNLLKNTEKMEMKGERIET